MNKENKDKPLLESKWIFHDQLEFDYFLESIRNYPKIRRFQEEWENMLRSWTKYDSFSEIIETYKEVNPNFNLDDVPWVIRESYYQLKKEWLDEDI